jgi:CRP-like cAMP-binding protein
VSIDRDATELHAILAPLRETDLFRSLDDAAAARLARRLARRRYRADEPVFHQGDPGDRLHVIESGRVRIGMDSEDGRVGTLTVLGPGQVFGELVLLDGAPRSASAVALEPTVTVTLDRATFRSLLAEDEGIREAVLAGVAGWLRRLTEQMTELHFLDLRGRVAATLVRMAREAGLRDGPVVLPALTQTEVASLVAGTRQRVNGVLGDLGREGLIRYDGKRITVLDVDRLARRIEG